MTSDTYASEQFSLFKDTMARHILARPALRDASDSLDNSDIDEFTTYLAQETWPVLPPALQSATYEIRNSIPDPDTVSLDATPLTFIETLVSYSLVSDEDDALVFLRKVVVGYVAEACAPPPVWKSTRTTECEICERDIPLSYHHLIPRSTHAKVLKKGWHPESQLNSVAWLCRWVGACGAVEVVRNANAISRQCHSTVHSVAPNEDLARYFYTVELLLEREDIQKWKKYAAKQRFGMSRRMYLVRKYDVD